MSQNTTYSHKFLLFFIIVLTFFGLGFYIGQNSENIPTTSEEIKDSIQEIIGNKHSKQDLELEEMWQVYNLILKDYYDADVIDKKQLEYGIITGMVQSLGDKFSEYMTPEVTKEFEESLSGDFEGIGAVISQNPLGVQIEQILKGSPAQKNGLMQGDIILQADEVELEGMTASEAVNYIKGPGGTKVTLKILRLGEGDYITKEIIREKIKIPSVEKEDIGEENLAYIAINIFGEDTDSEFKQYLKEVDQDPNITGLIIDLRDNGGGYLETAVDILSNFIPKGDLLVTTKYKDNSQNTPYYSKNRGGIFDKKIVILINENTASASEITAGALKDYNKAILVGTKSYGKGSVQYPFNLPSKSMLKLTIAKWYTPKDISIDHDGITPDVEVEFEKSDYTPKEGEEDDFEFYDRQLEEAKTILKYYIELDNIALTIEKYENEKKLLDEIHASQEDQDILDDENTSKNEE